MPPNNGVYQQASDIPKNFKAFGRYLHFGQVQIKMGFLDKTLYLQKLVTIIEVLACQNINSVIIFFILVILLGYKLTPVN